MLTREQVYTLLKIRNRENNAVSDTPTEIIRLISMNDDPNSEIHIALGLAASGTQKDMDTLVAMVKANPRLLLEASSVTTPGGIFVSCTTLYEFLLLDGDPDGAKHIEFGFDLIKDGGAKQRDSQYAYFKPNI
jgi:hypothetical protein